MAASDYVEIMWRPSDTGVSIEHYPTSTTPTRPAVPSVIATLSYMNTSSTANVYVSARGKGTATLTHFANSTADKTFGYVIVG
jgi:hypothetical protein